LRDGQQEITASTTVIGKLLTQVMHVTDTNLRAKDNGGLLQRGEVLAVRLAVGGHHVQELARLVGGALTIEVIGHLGQAGLDRGGEAAVALNDPVAAVRVGGDQQRNPDTVLGDRRAKLRRQPAGRRFSSAASSASTAT
jgi:hypothetical protein